jgi:L-lactate dehydrogenase complex protein LldG
MNNQRSLMLETIRQSLKSGLLPGKDTSPQVVDSSVDDRSRIVEDFIRELVAVGAHARTAATSAQARAMILDLMRDSAAHSEDKGTAKQLLAWNDSELPIPDLGSALRAEGFVMLDSTLSAGASARRARLAELGCAATGLTGAQGGLADSGTLAILSGPGRPRLASLLPPVHIAVIPKRSIYPCMADFFAADPGAILKASNLVFITGPSRTADIEQTLTLGVHGPREVFVIVID